MFGHKSMMETEENKYHLLIKSQAKIAAYIANNIKNKSTFDSFLQHPSLAINITYFSKTLKTPIDGVRDYYYYY